jgi:hypothetical protein
VFEGEKTRWWMPSLAEKAGIAAGERAQAGTKDQEGLREEDGMSNVDLPAEHLPFFTMWKMPCAVLDVRTPYAWPTPTMTGGIEDHLTVRRGHQTHMPRK